MATERHSKKDFENALPKTKDGTALWEATGLQEGEETYRVKVKDDVFISVRSSVRANGFAASTGKDSIRSWLVDEASRPLGSKVQAYVTRCAGWDERLVNILRTLWKRGANLQPCPTCGKMMGVFKVKKEGKNKGRLFSKCWNHNHFTWLDGKVSAKPQRARPERIPVVVEDSVVLNVRMYNTIKKKVAYLRESIKDNPPMTAFALMKIYEKQTEAEKSAERTVELNGVGFSGRDGEILSSFARQFRERGTLFPKQLAIAATRMPHYAVQLEKILRQWR